MEDSNRKEDGSCKEKPPSGMAKAKEDVRQPSPKTKECGNVSHISPVIVFNLPISEKCLKHLPRAIHLFFGPFDDFDEPWLRH